MHINGVDVLLEKLPFPLKGESSSQESSYALLAPPPWILESTIGCWISEWITVKEESYIYSFSSWAPLPSWPRWSRYVSIFQKIRCVSLGAKSVPIMAWWESLWPRWQHWTYLLFALFLTFFCILVFFSSSFIYLGFCLVLIFKLLI
jgi:hypothetical protein